MGMFDGIMPNSEQGSPIDVLKSLLDKVDIEMKTDLNIQQIKILVLLKLYYLLKSERSCEDCIDIAMAYYMQLMVSIGRGSRKEITEAIKQMRDSLMQNEGLLNAAFNKK